MTRAEEFPIETERLVLRHLEVKDLDAVMSYFTVPDVQRYLDVRVHDRADVLNALAAMSAQRWLNRPGDAIFCGIERQDDKRLIGQISLRWTDATAAQAELRFIIAPDMRNRGYATEAVKAMVDAGFVQFHFHRVFARCAGQNRASARLLRGLGMRLEAHYREHALYEGEWDEELHFAVLDREWARGSAIKPLPVLPGEQRLTA
jgi:RimJ/RimL family protein N-acetyltransferase